MDPGGPEAGTAEGSIEAVRQRPRPDAPASGSVIPCEPSPPSFFQQTKKGIVLSPRCRILPQGMDATAARQFRLIGLTGSLAAGKSKAGAILREHGFRVVDADELAKALLLDEDVRDEIRKHLGDDCYLSDGTPDRKHIASVIFQDREKREWLNGLIHPRVRRQVMEMTRTATVVYDVPLLFESGTDKETDISVMIDAPLEERIARAEKRNGWSREEFLAREAAQMPPGQKRLLADFVIDNDGDEEQLRKRLDRLIETLKRG